MDSDPSSLIEPEILAWFVNVPDGVVWLDLEGRIGWLNPTAKSIIPASDPLGKRLETWFQPIFSDPRVIESLAAPWWQGTPAKGILGMAGRRWRWFHVSTAPYKSGQLCYLTEVTHEYNQSLAYHSSLEVLSSLLTQEENLDAVLLRVLQTAADVVPGAEAGSLLLFEDDHFRFVAHTGFSPALSNHFLEFDHEFHWYGLGEQSWLLGKPRMLVSPQIQQRATLLACGLETFLGDRRIHQLAATICVPVVLQGKVMATLNLDAFSSNEAFPPEALSIAQTFSLQAATILYGLLSRQTLSNLALTDALTGLGNRRALENTFPKLQAQALRLGLPLALIYWDMDGLKLLNDRHGHAAGDQALKALATALQHVSRQGDLAFRIGGDEFVSLHLGLALRETPELVERMRLDSGQRVSAGGIEVQGQDSLEQALHYADIVMYKDKHG